jgi:hypothetical protein
LPSNGWRTIAAPGEIPGVDKVNRRTDGLITVWHEIGQRGDDARWRVTSIATDGAVRQATGPSKRSTRNTLRAAR